MAKDIIHDAVKNALIKDGWTITADPYRIRYKGLTLFADLSAERPIAAKRDGHKIVVEIKSFIGRSFIVEFQRAIGQYEIYRGFLKLTVPEYQLYLAVSEFSYNRSFDDEAIQAVIEFTNVSLFVVNIEREEIVKWIN
ncbi:MAG: XisH protein [Planctomycetes bacterium]|nr:XisH protein [Planctomycetota bacterium]